MKNILILWAPVLLAASSACLAPSDDPTAGEHVLETGAAATTQTDAPMSAAEVAVWMRENVPVWRVYLGGDGYDRHHHTWNSKTLEYWTTPGDSDVNAPLIFVRAGEEKQPERWVQLRLWCSWMAGDAYFEKLITDGVLTAFDLLSMQAVLRPYEGGQSEPPSIRSLPAATQEALFQVDIRSRAACPSIKKGSAQREQTTSEQTGEAASPVVEGGDYNPFPGLGPSHPGDDHTGPAPRGGRPGSGPSHGGGSGNPGSGKGLGHGGGTSSGHHGNSGPDGTRHVPGPTDTSDRDQANGVWYGDPAAIPFAENPGYHPKPEEKQVRFRCNGTIYYGYKGGCADFADDSSTNKWARTIPRVFAHASRVAEESFRAGLISMSHGDWVKLCRVVSGIAVGFGCAGAIASCAAGESVTLGTITIPCAAAVPAVCGGLTAEGNFFDCEAWANYPPVKK